MIWGYNINNINNYHQQGDIDSMAMWIMPWPGLVPVALDVVPPGGVN